jgi:hypothetical protein
MKLNLEPLVSRSVLVKRFSEFSTAGSFILLCIQDNESKDTAYIVLENEEWYFYSQRMEILSFTSHEEYTGYMVDNAANCIPVPTRIFQELDRLFRAPCKEEYTGDVVKGIHFFRQKYLVKVSWISGYEIREKKHAQDRSFLRILLEMGLVVRRECESGRLYVEMAELEALRLNN